ncbi:TPA: type-F conjugative transfer system secretin TraK [Pseudomonas aeruginosa]|nr:type-F conjugative transfer system secretin TraK [Pseudomonas aeruginosa]HDV6143736.1 type-F conjugative transfer system secretin TraK [Pseudomonas aeruginosa]HDV6167196.1 type-F conjugative transfer system secretin TraK [Pseudomonas aeruginosa]
MNRNNRVLSVVALAIAATLSVQVGAKELVIPKLPSAAQTKAEVIPPNQVEVDPSEFGVGLDAQEAEAKKALGSAQAAAPEAPAAEKSEPKPELIEVSGGGRGEDLQQVPASVARTTQMEPEATPVSSKQDVVVQPGVNTIIPAAVNHLNRIVTPFEKPIVQTVSSANIKVRENVIYVSTADESPVTMYITPKDDEAVAISLTLAPRRVPPIEANLVLGETLTNGGQAAAGGARASGGFHYSGQAKKWEEGQPYMEAIKNVMTSLALGKTPKGYSIGKANSLDTVPACYQDGIAFDFSSSQIVMGHNFKVIVGVASNRGQVPTMFDETSCTHPTLAATAVWPRNMLEPGEKTEVYVITRVGEAPAEESTRPSLLN